MRTNTALTDLESRAAEALVALLGQVSGVKLKEMRREPAGRGQAAAFLARIDVFGHSHTLACEVKSDAEPSNLRAELRDFPSGAPPLPGDAGATPVIIAPYFSPEAQTVCKESRAGFLDLEGNARLSVGELFIGMRSLPRQPARHDSIAPHKSPERASAPANARNHLSKFSRNHAEAALTA